MSYFESAISPKKEEINVETVSNAIQSALLANKNNNQKPSFNYDNCIVVHIDKPIDKDVLETIFSNKEISGNGRIEHIELNSQKPIAFIYYENISSKLNALKFKKLKISGYEFCIKEYQQNRSRASSLNSVEVLSTPIRSSSSARFNPRVENKPQIIPRSINQRNLSIPRAQSRNFHNINRYIIIDGSNVAVTHGKGKKFSVNGVRIAINFLKNKEKEYKLKQKGINLIIKVIIPNKRKNPNCRDVNPTVNFEALDQLEKDDYLLYVPSDQYDDEYILNFAMQSNGLILSGDRFKDFEVNEKLKKYFSKNQIKFQFMDDYFFIPDKPNGRYNKSLEELITDVEPVDNSISSESSSSDSEDNQDSNLRKNNLKPASITRKNKKGFKKIKNEINLSLIRISDNKGLFNLICSVKNYIEEKYDVKLHNQANFSFKVVSTKAINYKLVHDHIKLLKKHFTEKDLQVNGKRNVIENLLKRKLQELAPEDEKNFYISISKLKLGQSIIIYASSWSIEGKQKLNEVLDGINVETSDYRSKKFIKNLNEIIDSIESEIIVKIDLSSLSADRTLKIISLDLKSQSEAKKMLELTVNEDSTMITPKSHLLLNLFKNSNRTELNKWMQDNNVTYKIEKKIISLKGTALSLDKAKQMLQNELEQIQKDLKKLRFVVPLNLFRFLSFSSFERNKLENEYNVSLTMPKTNLEPVLVFEINLIASSKLRLLVCNGTIEEASCDYMINSVNENLSNFDGAARAIADAAGIEYKQECDALIQSNKKLNPNEIYQTKAGNLCAKEIINVVCSKYELNSTDLIKKYFNCIKYCINLEKNQHEKIVIAMTLLGTGILNWPLDESFSQLINCIEFLPESNLPNFNIDILLVENDKDNINRIINLIVTKRVLLVNLKLVNSNQLLSRNTNEKNWYWYDDENQWKKFRTEIQNEINEKAKEANVFQISIDNKMYEINLLKRTQINVKTKYAHSISDEIPFVETVQWYWYDTGNRKTAYNLLQNSLIEDAFCKNNSSIELNIKRHADDHNSIYIIDTKSMIQKNKITGYKRKIEREIVKQKAEIIIEDMQKEEKELDFFDHLSCDIWLSGKENSILSVTQIINKFMVDKKIIEKLDGISLNSLKKNLLLENGFRILNDNNNRIRQITKNGVEINEENSSLVLSGLLEKDLKSVKEELLTIHLKNFISIYPSNWTNLTSENLTIVRLVKNSKEWNDIENNFKKTLPSNQIIKIERIQNKAIYENFDRDRNYLSKLRNNQINEKFLWHGTRNTDPKLIYEGERFGFDFRYSDRGKWGTGTYFAENASYSLNFSYSNHAGEKQFFYAQVLLGDCIEMSSDPSLKMPPKKKNNPTDSYDSVKGITGGSNVYIVYENQRAYPTYLVTFK